MHTNETEYQKYYFAFQELERAHKFLSYLIKNKMHTPLPRGKNKSIQQEAFTISFIITYAKPFTNNNGFGMISFKRNELSQEKKAVHDEIMNLRKKAFAHIDSEIHEVKTHPDFTFISSPFIAIPEVKCLLLNEIIERIKADISLRLAKLKPYAPQYKWP
jgi:hypothetical protein